MAREIVITSVPRGVRPGRTGFQIAMRTAGLREDVCDQLEALGVYRHLPPGVGPNPVCYFHKLVQTGIGPLQVLGRVLDAGADYSSRSNKLAHLVAIEAAELAGLRQSSPAAVLAAIEARLARTWPGGPEERQRPFDLAGMPTEAPRICIGWQQAAGDAGWGGVLAEQAVKNKPVLVIAPDSSPDWCRRLLALFAEALALVPPARRWNVTFDTTILSAAPVTWRGTYADSPESGSRQPGLLVVDLRGRPAVPAEMAGLPLVQQARSGIIEAPVAGRAAPIGPRVPVPPPVGDESVVTLPDTSRGGVSGIPPPLARNRRLGRHDDEESNHWQAWIAWGVIGLLLLIGATVGFFIGVVQPQWVKNSAQGRINACAQQADGRPPEGRAAPTVEDWLAAYGEEKKDKKNKVVSEGLDRSQLEGRLSLLNSLLLTKAVTPGDAKDLAGVKSLIERLERLKSGNLEVADLRTIDVKLPAGGAEVDAQVLTWLNPLLREPRFAQVNDVQKVQQLATDLQPLAELVSATEASASARAVLIQPTSLKKAIELVIVDEDVKRNIDNQTASTDGLRVKLVGTPTLTLELLRQGIAELSKQSARTGMPNQDTALAGANAAGANAAGANAAGANAAGANAAGANAAGANAAGANAPGANAPGANAAGANDWQTFRNRVESTSRQPHEWNSQPLDLVTGIKWTHLNPTKCRIVLASAGEWKPKAEQEAGKPEWKLLGVPGDDKKHWGTIKFDGADDSWKVTFKAEEGAPWVCGYVPIHFSHPAVEGSSDPPIRPLRIATKPQSLSWKVTGPANWAELAGFTAEGGMNVDEATLAIDDQVLGLCAPRLKPQVVGKVGNLLVEQVPPQGPPNVMILTYSSLRSQDSLNVVTRFTSEAQPLGVTVKPELNTSWTSLVRHDFKGIEEIDWKNLADPKKKPVWILQWQRVVQGWTETMLPKASWNTDELMKRLGTRPIGGALESQYEPWGPIPPNIKSQKLHEWKKMAVDYVVKKGRHFWDKASNKEDDALRKTAENPAAVQEFLARETKWRADVEATFADDVQSKADQNELLALLVLAYLDGVVAIKSDPDSVRNAFGEKIADCVKAEVWIDWTFNGRPGLEEVQVAKVVGAAPDDLKKK